MAYLMGIDLGSTSIKAVIYDEHGKMVSNGYRPTPLTYDNKEQPSWCVWEPEKIWDCVCASIRQALAELSDPQEVKAVAVTGFGMDGLPMDKDGKPLYPMISWHCPRTIPQYERFTKEVGKENIFRLTGKQPQSIDSIYRMIWMKENHPEILEKTDTWLLIEDYVNYMLCGVMGTDYSMATCTSAFDQRTHSWCEDLIKTAGIPTEIFPEARQSGFVLGKIQSDAAGLTGLSKDTQIVLGGHDYICAALSVGAVDSSVLLDITGTWEMLIMAADKVQITDNLYKSGLYLEGHVAKDRCCYVANSICGDMTEWMKVQLCKEEELRAEAEDINIWQAIEDTCRQSPAGSRGCTFLPHFSGAGTPNYDMNSMGAFIGLHNPTERGDLIRSVFEGLDYQLMEIIDAYKTFGIGDPSRIITTGGSTRNTFWMQNKADVTGSIIEVPDLFEATPMGAALMAGVGIGVFSNEQEAFKAVRSDITVYEPDLENHKLYTDLYENVYRKLQNDLKDVNAALSKRFR